MKNKMIVLTVLVLLTFCITGCNSTVKAVPYSLVNDENDHQTATIFFVRGNDTGGGVRLVDYEELELPQEEKKTHWNPITLPAGVPLSLRVYIYWGGDQKGSRRRGIFNCPPLEAGSEFKLWYDRHTYSLVLTDTSVEKLYDVSRPKRKQPEYTPLFEPLYAQEVPPLKERFIMIRWTE